jgi:hypothetical protein
MEQAELTTEQVGGDLISFLGISYMLIIIILIIFLNRFLRGISHGRLT